METSFSCIWLQVKQSHRKEKKILGLEINILVTCCQSAMHVLIAVSWVWNLAIIQRGAAHNEMNAKSRCHVFKTIRKIIA